MKKEPKISDHIDKREMKKMDKAVVKQRIGKSILGKLPEAFADKVALVHALHKESKNKRLEQPPDQEALKRPQ